MRSAQKSHTKKNKLEQRETNRKCQKKEIKIGEMGGGGGWTNKRERESTWPFNVIRALKCYKNGFSVPEYK